jgi:hypothetical protein
MCAKQDEMANWIMYYGEIWISEDFGRQRPHTEREREIERQIREERETESGRERERERERARERLTVEPWSKKRESRNNLGNLSVAQISHDWLSHTLPLSLSSPPLSSPLLSSPLLPSPLLSSPLLPSPLLSHASSLERAHVSLLLLTVHHPHIQLIFNVKKGFCHLILILILNMLDWLIDKYQIVPNRRGSFNHSEY